MWASNIKSPEKPSRIISLVPSQTELLYHLELEKETIGITKFCVHPSHWLSEKKRIGGTKNINVNLIRSLNPDLIIANKEENIKKDVIDLANDFPVWVTDVQTLDDALKMITDIGTLTDRKNKSQRLTEEIDCLLQNEKSNSTIDKKGLYLIWKDPFMTIGGDTYIHEMMKLANIENIYQDETRYPEVLDLVEKGKEADVILLSSEPYPFNETHVMALHDIFPDKLIKLVDGEMFSWFGSRLLESIPYLSRLNSELNHNQA